MEQRYCIGCAHLRYEDKSMAYGTTLTGPWTAEQASLGCRKDHWSVYLSSYGQEQFFDLENAMLSAATCPDFRQREIPKEAP